MRYRLGGDGSDGTIDCIHMVLAVEQQLSITAPVINAAWYEGSCWAIYRDLLNWGKAIKQPTYDGDVIVFPGEDWAFGVVWHSGLLLINRKTELVQWFPLSAAQSLTGFHCFRSKER
jgi:hypothetical protein